MKNFKKVISAVVALALSASTFVSASNFTDVADTASYAEAIDVLSALGIVNGYAEEDGTFTFKPEGTITRAEAATMIVGALNMTEDAKASAGTSKFADVNSQASWATGYVNVGVAQGFISGMDDTTFAPQENVTYAQMCVMLTSIAGYGEYAAKNGGYPTGYTSMAATTGINKGVAVSNDTALTRGQVAQMIWNTLQAPMLGVYEYSFQGNTYTQLDGKAGRDFKTLLSDKFDGYVVTAFVSATAKTDSGLDNNESRLVVTKADWWNDEAIPCSNNALGHNHNVTALLDGISLDDMLYQSGKAVMVIDDLDDAHIVYFAANGKTETKEFAAEDYEKQAELKTSQRFGDTAIASPSPTTEPGQGKIRFGTKYYTMTTTSVTSPSPATFAIADLYINGSYRTTVNSANTGANATLDQYLGNAQGTIKMLKLDGENGYSMVFADYYDVAKVTSVTYKNNTTTVQIVPATGAIANAKKIVINDDKIEDGDVELSVKNGDAEIELKDLQKDDIIAYAMDLNSYAGDSTLTDPRALKVLVSRDTLSGKVTGSDAVEQVYSVDAKEYDAVNFGGLGLQIGSSYTMKLDPFGRIYAAEEDATSKKYAIVEKWVTSNDTVQMVLADGTTKSYELASGARILDAAGSAVPMTYASATPGIINNADGTKKDIWNRVVEYTIKNSDGTIKSIQAVTGTFINNEEFKSNTSKLGSCTINSSTQAVDASEYLDILNTSPKASDIEGFDVNGFANGSKYTAYAFKSAGTTVYSFVLLTNVGTAFTDASRFAVVKKTAEQGETKDGTECYKVTVLYDGVEQVLEFNNNPTSLAIGDAFFFERDNDGLVKTFYEVFNKATDTFTGFAGTDGIAGNGDDVVPASKYELGLALGAGATPSPVTGSTEGWNFKLADDGSDIQLVYGIVSNVKSNGIEFAVAHTPAGNEGAKYQYDANDDGTPDTYYTSVIDKNIDGDSSSAKGVYYFGIANDSVAYVYDAGDTTAVREFDKVQATAAEAVAPSNFDMFETAVNSNIFDFSVPNTIVPTENPNNYANYALAMVVDGDIVAIYAITK